MEDGPSTPPTHPPQGPGSQPTCWKCGYVLSGLRVDGVCPECSTPIWGPRADASDRETEKLASGILVWGVVSLCLTFACLGPLGGLVAIPAFMKHREFRILNNAGVATPSQASSAKGGIICARLAAIISIVIVVFYGVLLGAGFLS